MPKKNNKPRANGRFSLMNSYSEILNKQMKPNETLFYARDCLLPILNIKVLVKERAREELNDVDLTLFKLIDQGIRSIKSIVTLTGLAEKLVAKHLNELLGRSLVSYTDDKFYLTEIGRESLLHGVPFRTVQRAFRYCAVSEKLLPREAYELVYTELSSLRGSEGVKAVKRSQVLEEKALVNLSGLSLSNVKSKRDLNITDEAVGFEKALDYTSGYLQTRLFILGRSTPQRALVSFGRSFREYNLQEVLSMIQKIDDFALKRFKEKELNQGIDVSEMKLDGFGLPLVKVSKANEKWLSKKVESGQQAILFCGTNKHEPKPVSSWALNGYTVRYQLGDSSMFDEVDLLRLFNDRCEHFFTLDYENRPFPKLTDYIYDLYSQDQLQKLSELAEKYSIKRIQSWLPKGLKDAV